MIDILLNGENYQVKEQTSIAELLEQLGMQGQRLAVEHNLEILPKSEHAATCLQAQDRVEIVHAIGGG